MKPHKYSDVVSGKVKPPKKQKFIGGAYMQPIEVVSWEGCNPSIVQHDFRTIGLQSVPIAPKMPDGFKMIDHPIWGEIAEAVKTGIETASFDRIDQMFLDLEDLQDITGTNMADCVGFQVFEHRRDYTNWTCEFEDAWDELLTDLDRLMKRAIEEAVPHMPIGASQEVIKEHIKKHGLNCEPLGNRTLPPSKANAIQAVIDYLEKVKPATIDTDKTNANTNT